MALYSSSYPSQADIAGFLDGLNIPHISEDHKRIIRFSDSGE